VFVRVSTYPTQSPFERSNASCGRLISHTKFFILFYSNFFSLNTLTLALPKVLYLVSSSYVQIVLYKRVYTEKVGKETRGGFHKILAHCIKLEHNYTVLVYSNSFTPTAARSWPLSRFLAAQYHFA
jgi:hypothetical protein